MQKLFEFFLRNSNFFLFLGLELVAMVMIFNNNEYQHSVLFSSSNAAVAGLYETRNAVTDYFGLREVNSQLAEENTTLRNKLIVLQNQYTHLTEMTDTLSSHYVSAENDLTVISAKVINNTTQKRKNYITLNKGVRDGVGVGMGVMVNDGVVGIVKDVSEKFSVVIPVLNSEINVSTKISSSGYVGLLEWYGESASMAYLSDIPRHVDLVIGDALVTSGLTSNFPEGIPVGYIHEFELAPGNSYFTIKVELAVNFETLAYVSVIKNNNSLEQLTLEQDNID